MKEQMKYKNTSINNRQKNNILNYVIKIINQYN